MKSADKKAAEEAALAGPWSEFLNFAEWRNARTAMSKVQLSVANFQPGNNSRQLRYVFQTLPCLKLKRFESLLC
jgi:hypothetical protein